MLSIVVSVVSATVPASIELGEPVSKYVCLYGERKLKRQIVAG